MSESSRSFSHGFWMKSRAPRLMDSTARSMLPQAVITITGKRGVELLNARQQIEALLAGGGVAGVVEVDEQHVVVALAQRFKQQLGRAHAVHMDALRREQQLDGLKDVRLIVGDQDADLFVAYWRWSASTAPALALSIEMPYSSRMAPVARRTSMRAFS